MTEKNTGGPAFPNFAVDSQDNFLGEAGMTMRDYFAAKAMQAMAAAPMGKFNHSKFDELAESAYAMADAMLEARDK